MRGHLIRGNNNTFDFQLHREDGYVFFKYQADDKVHMILNDLISRKKHIYFSNNKQDIIVRVLENDYQNHRVGDNAKLREDMLLFIRLLQEVDDIVGEISYFDNDYKILIDGGENYKHIFDYYLLKRDSQYIFNAAMWNDLYKEISRYHKLMKVCLVQIDEEVMDINLDAIKRYYQFDKNSKLIICNRNGNLELLIIGNRNFKFVFKNEVMFFKIFLPEILKMYVTRIKKITKEEVQEQFAKKFAMINNNLYFLGVEGDLVDSSIVFMQNLIGIQNYHLEVNKKYVKRDEEYEQKPQPFVNKYSYGYINILLIAFILSIITIIFCLSRY